MQLRAVSSKLFAAICGLALLAIPASASTTTRSCATKADAQSPYGGSGGHSIWLPGIATDFIFTPDPGVFTEPGDGTARLVGTVRRAGNSSQAFRVDLSFSGYSATAPPDSPHVELSNNAYVWGGGPIDPATWHYYSNWGGTLTGIDAYAGAVLNITRRGPAFQVGTGANGKNLRYGASGWLRWTVVHQPNSGSLQTTGDGDVNIDLGNCPPASDACATKADVNPTYAIHPGGHSIWLPGIGTDFVFSPRGTFIEAGDGTATLTGTVRRVSNPGHAFNVSLSFSGYSATAPPDSPHVELQSSAYVSGGGPIDPATWHYFSNWSGTFTGIDSFAGAVVNIARRGPAFQVGTGANGKNLLYGASGWLRWTVAQQPNSGSLQTTGDGDVNIDLGTCPPATEVCVAKADNDPVYGQYPDGHSIWLPGIGTDFIFSPDFGTFTEASNGTASLTGIVRRVSNSAEAFAVNLTFSAYSAAAPPDSPHIELHSGAYASNGGPIDPATWHYYSNWGGTLTGIDAYAGAVLDITRRGPAFQVGVGANGKNLLNGASGWLSWTVAHQPNSGSLQATGEGDVNVNLGNCITTTEICVREAIGDEHLPGVLSNHAISLPGATNKLVFEPLAQLIESSDGTAVLVGTAVDRNAPQKIFDVEITLSGRTTTPPPGSPVLGLAPGSYVANGGTIDPSTWVYYTSFTGTLTGHGVYEGAVVAISSLSPAWQQGVGANNRNDELGAAARYSWVTLHQPNTGSIPASGSTGLINVDLTVDCTPPLGGGNSKIGDLVWNDLDHDGIKDAGEPGLGGVLVRLYKDGVLVNVKLTNADGNYSFPSIPVGNYTVAIDTTTLPGGFEAIYDYDGTVSLHTISVTLGNHHIQLDVDFAYAAPVQPAACLPGVTYGIHASGGTSSQLFEIIPDGSVGALGAVCENDMIKAMDVSPANNLIYVVVGDGDNTGNLYVVDKSSGLMILVGNTGAAGASSEITDASFHPNGTLWAFQEEVGLLTLDLANGASTVEWVAGSGVAWEGLAWDAQGQVLYATQEKSLYRWDPATLTAELACANLPAETRALDVAGDGKLVGAARSAGGDLLVFEVNPATCDVRLGEVSTTYSNIESLAFENCGQPAPLHGPIFDSSFEGGLEGWTVVTSP